MKKTYKAPNILAIKRSLEPLLQQQSGNLEQGGDTGGGGHGLPSSAKKPYTFNFLEDENDN